MNIVAGIEYVRFFITYIPCNILCCLYMCRSIKYMSAGRATGTEDCWTSFSLQFSCIEPPQSWCRSNTNEHMTCLIALLTKSKRADSLMRTFISARWTQRDRFLFYQYAKGESEESLTHWSWRFFISSISLNQFRPWSCYTKQFQHLCNRSVLWSAWAKWKYVVTILFKGLWYYLNPAPP